MGIPPEPTYFPKVVKTKPNYVYHFGVCALVTVCLGSGQRPTGRKFNYFANLFTLDRCEQGLELRECGSNLWCAAAAGRNQNLTTTSKKRYSFEAIIREKWHPAETPHGPLSGEISERNFEVIYGLCDMWSCSLKVRSNLLAVMKRRGKRQRFMYFSGCLTFFCMK